MTEAYDPSNHLLAVAIIVFYWQMIRIWSQPPPPDHRGKPGSKRATTWPASTFSGILAPEQPALRSAESRASSNLPLAAQQTSGLAAIRAADASFDEVTFLAGASLAYERVVGAYGREDMSAVEGLLDPNVADDLAKAIAARRKRGERRVFTFVGLRSANILGAFSEAGIGEIIVRFTGDAASATWDAGGSLLSGDPAQVVEMTDIWTFSRPLAAPSPNWTVIATDVEP